MDFRLRRCWRAVLIYVFVGLIYAQVPSARAILNTPESEQAKFVKETMEAGFPEDRADQMTMLILNRSALVLPLIERRVEAELQSPSPSKSFIATAAEMIAYAGDEQSLRTVSKLIVIDDNRFGHLVGRTLNNALSFRNPFTAAYHGIENEDETIAVKIGAWTDSALSSQRMRHLWAEAILDKYQRVPSEADWARDPMASRLRDRDNVSLEFHQKIMNLAAEALGKRERQ